MKQMKMGPAGRRYIGALAAVLLCAACLAGCSASKDSGEKVRDLEFTVTGEMETPQELKEMLTEINASIVTPEEWLSDEVYYYSRERRQILFAREPGR